MCDGVVVGEQEPGGGEVAKIGIFIGIRVVGVFEIENDDAIKPFTSKDGGGLGEGNLSDDEKEKKSRCKKRERHHTVS